jgi:hypothetical protein
MSPLLDLEESRLAEQLGPILDAFEEDIAGAEKMFEIAGERLEVIARTLPQHQAFYSQRAKEAKHVVKLLENFSCKLESRLLKNLMQGQRAYGARETTVFIAGSPEMVAHNQLVIEVSLVRDKLEEIVEAFKQMGWMLQNITKLRVAELQDVIL